MGRRARYAQFSHAKQAAPPARPHFLGARKAPAWISLPSRVPRLVCHQTGRPLGERNSTSHVDAAPNVPSMAKRAGTGFSGGGGNPRAGQRGRLAEKDSQGSARMRPPRCLISPLGDGKQVSSRSRAFSERRCACLAFPDGGAPSLVPSASSASVHPVGVRCLPSWSGCCPPYVRMPESEPNRK